MKSAEEIVQLLGLEPHPEGGWYRETFRDAPPAGATRAASTAIYYLLAQGQVSQWHRIDAAEVWHWYAGAPLAISISPAVDLPAETRVLGSRVDEGEAPQIVVPARHWQRARCLGAWTLAGCTVAPGFTFDGFELAGPDFAPEDG